MAVMVAYESTPLQSSLTSRPKGFRRRFRFHKDATHSLWGVAEKMKTGLWMRAGRPRSSLRPYAIKRSVVGKKGAMSTGVSL